MQSKINHEFRLCCEIPPLLPRLEHRVDTTQLAFSSETLQWESPFSTHSLSPLPNMPLLHPHHIMSKFLCFQFIHSPSLLRPFYISLPSEKLRPIPIPHMLYLHIQHLVPANNRISSYQNLLS